MTSKDSKSTLQRKMAAGQNGAPKGGGRSALRALRLGTARAASQELDLSASVIGLTHARMGQETLAGHLPAENLLILLEGPGRFKGVAVVDRTCLAALIQVQTMGQVTGAQPSDRPFTSTDATMMSPLLDGTIAKAWELSDADSDKICFEGYRFGARVEDVGTLFMILDAERFRVFDLTIDFGKGLLQGNLCLALPDREVRREDDAVEAGGINPGMEKAVGKARAELTAVIGHVKMSLGDLARREPGDLLMLELKPLDETALVAVNGRKVAVGRLGQAGGMRAVRVNETRAQPRMGAAPESFEPGSMPQPEGGALMPLPTGEASWGADAMPSMPDLPLPDAPGADMAMPDLPDLPELPQVDMPDASDGDTMDADEISQLAGLSEEEREEMALWSQPAGAASEEEEEAALWSQAVET